jgi:hypothetical protein
VPVDRGHAGTAADGAQCDRDDHGVVGIADHRDEVRHEVDWRHQVDQQQRQPDPHAPRKRRIDGQTPDQANDVGKQPQCIPEIECAGSVAADDDKGDDHCQPQEREPGGQADHETPTLHEHQSTAKR